MGSKGNVLGLKIKDKGKDAVEDKGNAGQTDAEKYPYKKFMDRMDRANDGSLDFYKQCRPDQKRTFRQAFTGDEEKDEEAYQKFMNEFKQTKVASSSGAAAPGQQLQLTESG